MKIGIVGGGLAGLAYAIAASNKYNNDNDDNLEIVILEKRDFSNRGATFGLARSGQASMEYFAPDLLKELKEVGILIEQTGGYMLPWYKVRDGLLDLCRQQSSIITILSNTNVTSIVEKCDEEKVEVTFQQRTSGGGDDDNRTSSSPENQILYFDYVVGSDGVNSFVRKALGAPPAVSSDTLCWRGAVHAIPDDLNHIVEGPIATTYHHSKGIFAIFNFHKSMKNFISWVATSKNLEMESIVEAVDGIESDTERKDVQRLLEISQPQELTFRTLLCTMSMNEETGWGGKGRLTLIGDAAHALRPASGLGGSLAFEDVVLLCRCLHESKTTKDIPTALREFENLRFTRCKTIVDDQTRIAEVAYSKDRNDAKKYTWTAEYKEWVFTGPDASPIPPSKVYVDS